MPGKEDCKDPTFYTDYGEIRCETVKGKKRFVFYNPNLPESNEMVAFMKTFVGVANYLPEAQQVAAQYLLGRKPADAEAVGFEKGGEQAERARRETHRRVPREKLRRRRRSKTKTRSSARSCTSSERSLPSG